MKTTHHLSLAAVFALSLLASGCGGSSSGNSSTPTASGPNLPPPGAPVPASAGGTVTAFLGFLLSMNPNDETSEPSTMSESFAVPASEADDVQPLT